MIPNKGRVMNTMLDGIDGDCIETINDLCHISKVRVVHQCISRQDRIDVM